MKSGVVLIVGANGALGTAFAQKLNSDYYTIGTTRRGATQCDKTILATNLSLEKDNICTACHTIVNQTGLPLKMVIYIAGFGYREDELTDEIKKEMYQINCYVANDIAQSFSDVTFIYISSCAILGTDGTDGFKTYAETKRLAEALLKETCSHLILVRPTIIRGTQFFERAGLPSFTAKGFKDSNAIVQYVLTHLHQSIILPDYQSKLLHFLQTISPELTQKFLSTPFSKQTSSSSIKMLEESKSGNEKELEVGQVHK